MTDKKDDLKAVFNDLSKSLQHLHKALLMSEAKKLEAIAGKKLSPYELLNASLGDPSLAWLRVMSELIVNLDTLIDETPKLSAQDSHRMTDEVLNVIEKPEGLMNNDFWTHYSDYLANDPNIIVLHSRTKSILSQLRPTL